MGVGEGEVCVCGSDRLINNLVKYNDKTRQNDGTS